MATFDWKAIIALLALILSQLPPIKQMLKGKRLRMVVADIAQLFHLFGNTNLSLWIDLENVGGKTITIRRIKSILARREEMSQTLTAKTYYVTESFSRDRVVELPFAEIALKAGEKWSGLIHFWDTQTLSKSVETKLKSAISKIRNNVIEKVSQQNNEMASVPVLNRPLVEADSELLQEILEIVKNLGKIEEGEYELLVAVYEEPDHSPFKIQGFDLTVFESDVKDIFEDTEDYKYGFGIHLPSRKNKTVDVHIRSKNEKESKKRFNILSGQQVNI